MEKEPLPPPYSETLHGPTAPMMNNTMPPMPNPNSGPGWNLNMDTPCPPSYPQPMPQPIIAQQQMYQPQMEPQMMQQPVQPVHQNVIILNQQLNLNGDPVPIVCIHCHQSVITKVENRSSCSTHCLAAVLAVVFCFTLIPCCCVPYLFNYTKDAYHTCPSCNGYIGIYRREQERRSYHRRNTFWGGW